MNAEGKTFFSMRHAAPLDGPAGFSARLVELRLSRELTQQQLSRAMKCGLSSVYQYENGVAHPTFWTLLEIARFFNVTLDFLMGHTVRGEQRET